MTTLRNIDVLNKALAFHEQARAYFGDETDEAQKPEVQALLSRLDRHEAVIELCEDEYVHCANPVLLEEWHGAGGAWPNIAAFGLPSKLTTQALLTKGAQVDACLRSLYRELRKNTSCDDLRAAIAAFEEAEKWHAQPLLAHPPAKIPTNHA